MSAPASPKLRWIAAGISQLLRLTSVEGKRGKVFRGLSNLLYLVGGISLLGFPIQSTLSLTLFLGFLLAIEGVMELAAAAAGGGPADRRIAPQRHLGDRQHVGHRPGLLGGEPAHGAGVPHPGLRRGWPDRG